MAEGAPQSIIIKKVKKGGHAAHHGGAWKIAYADFVTAMMAFFLLLWLLNAVPQESLEGISNYFAPVSVSESTSGSGGVLGGKVMSEEEAGISESSSSVTMDLPPPSAGSGGDDQASAEDIAEDAAREAMEALEQQQFDEAQQKIIQAIEADETLSQLKDSLKMDDTPEGLRIQLLDQDGLPMFQSGGATMLAHTRKVMALVAKVIKNMPQQISISGHTDSVPFSDDHGYSNWELSSDRANSARRELMDDGVPYERVSQVIGKASTEPLMEDNPTHPSNRRLSIVSLRGSAGPLDAEEEILPGLSDIKQKQLEDTLNSIE
ncbi:MAG: flagellar motor protein MotB [Rhodospirillales bacterium]|nr:flagellar motor protein MotB [Rhodospirillales bacterium]